MIECEECSNYFHPDDIRPCPHENCAVEDLCPNCYNKHSIECIGNF